jgi:hypothetical protein
MLDYLGTIQFFVSPLKLYIDGLRQIGVTSELLLIALCVLIELIS